MFVKVIFMLRTLFTLGVFAVVLAAPAQANGKTDVAACKAMQATLVPRQTEITGLTERRDASAIAVEAAGEAWEDVEIHRLISDAHAAAADSAKAAYTSARQQLARDEMALQATVKQFNTDVSVFNARCSTKG